MPDRFEKDENDNPESFQEPVSWPTKWRKKMSWDTTAETTPDAPSEADSEMQEAPLEPAEAATPQDEAETYSPYIVPIAGSATTNPPCPSTSTMVDPDPDLYIPEAGEAGAETVKKLVSRPGQRTPAERQFIAEQRQARRKKHW